jgi:NitT/TauT family transport system ATP-binding protein
MVARRITVVFVTHDVDEGVYLSTRVVALTRAPGTIAIVGRLPATGPQE